MRKPAVAAVGEVNCNFSNTTPLLGPQARRLHADGRSLGIPADAEAVIPALEELLTSEEEEGELDPKPYP